MNATSLGRTLSTHRGLFSAGGWLWYLGGVLLAAGVFNVGKGALSIVTNTVTNAPGSGMSGVVMGLICFLIAPLVLALPVLRWRQELVIHEEGFVWHRLWGDKVVPRASVRSVTRVQHFSRMGAFVELVVQLADGTEVSMSGLDGAEQASNLIAQLARPAPAAPVAGGWSPPGSTS